MFKLPLKLAFLWCFYMFYSVFVFYNNVESPILFYTALPGGFLLLVSTIFLKPLGLVKYDFLMTPTPLGALLIIILSSTVVYSVALLVWLLIARIRHKPYV